MGKTTNLAPSFSFASLRENQRRPDYLPDEEAKTEGRTGASTGASLRDPNMKGFFVPRSLIKTPAWARPDRPVLICGADSINVPPFSAFYSEEDSLCEFDEAVNRAFAVITAMSPCKISGQAAYSNFEPLSCQMVWDWPESLTRPLEMVAVEEDRISSNQRVFSLAHYTYDPTPGVERFYLLKRFGPQGAPAEDTPYQRMPGPSKLKKMIDEIKERSRRQLIHTPY